MKLFLALLVSGGSMTIPVNQVYSEMMFVDRSTAVAAGAAETLSLQGGTICASTLRHDLGVDMTRTKYTGIGKFCMRATEPQRTQLDSLARAITKPYVPDPTRALAEAAFDYRLRVGNTVHSGSYGYDGDDDFDRSLAPFDLLVREVVQRGDAIAGFRPSVDATLEGGNLLVTLSLSNCGRVDLALTGPGDWGSRLTGTRSRGVVIRIFDEKGLATTSALTAENLLARSARPREPLLIPAGQVKTLHFSIQAPPEVGERLRAGDPVVMGTLQLDADFQGELKGLAETPVEGTALKIL